jgi:hypothetical protein
MGGSAKLIIAHFFPQATASVFKWFENNGRKDWKGHSENWHTCLTYVHRANISKFCCVKNRRKFAIKKATNYDCDDDGNKLWLQL